MRNLVWIVVSLALGAAPSAWAEGMRLQPDFTFKRVTVPQGTGPRITVQIDPEERVLAPLTESGLASEASEIFGAVGGAVPQASQVSWFWQAVSPKLEDNVPGRLVLALEAMRHAPAENRVEPPSLEALTRIAARHGRDILLATIDTKVSPALVLSVIAVESAGQSNAVSRAGALGLMQLMPATAERFGVRDPLDPVDNIAGGVAYLDWLMAEFDGDPILVLAGYNAGEGTIRDQGGVPEFVETRLYVPKVLAAWTVAKALCVTPPELMSDGCVFAVKG